MSSRKRHDSSSSSSDSSSGSASGKDSDDSDSSQSSNNSRKREKTRNTWRTAEKKTISPIRMSKGYREVESGELSSSDNESPGKAVKSSVQRLVTPSKDKDSKKPTTDESDERSSSESKGRQPKSDNKVIKEQQREETMATVPSKSKEETDRRKDRNERSRSPRRSTSREKEDHVGYGAKRDLETDKPKEKRPGKSPRRTNSPRDEGEHSRSRDPMESQVDPKEDQQHRSDHEKKDQHPSDRHDNKDRHRPDRRGYQHRSDHRDEKDLHRSDRHGDRDQRRREPRDRQKDQLQRDDQDKENRNREIRRDKQSDRKRPSEDASRQDGDKDSKGEVTRPSAKKTKEGDTILTRTGGAYIPPARLRMMQAEITDKTSVAYQRIAWEALKKSINGRINKVNTSNLIEIVKELFQENIVRGRGLLARSIIQAQAASPTFTAVYAALVAIINTKFPQNGELILRRLIIQFRKGFRRNDKNLCLSSTRFLAHLVNQQVAHEVLSLEVLTLLMETPTDDSVEVAVGFLKECGQKLTEVSPRGINAIFDRLRNILHEGQIDTRVQYMVEVMFAVRKDGFKDHPSLVADLDLVEEDDQFTHLITLDDAGQTEDILNVFKADPDFQVNEDKYKTLKKEILDEDSSGSESGGGSDGEDSSEEDDEEDEEEKQKIIDQTETNLVALRRTIYLTVQSSLDFEECAHKIIRLELKPGQEVEVCNMILDCCAQLRTYEKFYGLLAQRFCQIDKKYIEPFQNIFKEQYETVHRLETNKLRIVAKFFAHLLHTDAIAWGVLSCVRLNEDDTTSASRIFVKILFQELSEYMGLTKLNNRIKDPTLQIWFEGIMPRDNPKNTRFAINFFTTIGLGGLTDDLRDHLRNMSKQLMQQKQQAEPESESSDSSDSGSDSDSSSDSSTDSSESSDSSSDSDPGSKKKPKKKGTESPKKKEKKSVANGVVRDSDIFPNQTEPTYSDPWDRRYKGSNKISKEKKERSKSDSKSTQSNDRKSRSENKHLETDDRKRDKSSRSDSRRSRSHDRQPEISDRKSRSDGKKGRADERNSTTDLNRSRSNEKGSRASEKSSRQEMTGSRSKTNERGSRSDKRSRPEDERSRQDDNKQRPDKRRTRSDEELSPNDNRSRQRDKRSRQTDEISKPQERNLRPDNASSNERNSRSNGKSSQSDGRDRRRDEKTSARNENNSRSDGKISKSSDKMPYSRRSRSLEKEQPRNLPPKDHDLQMNKSFERDSSSDSDHVDRERKREHDKVRKQNKVVNIEKKSRSRRSDSGDIERESPSRVKKRRFSDEKFDHGIKYSKSDKRRDQDSSVEVERQERNGSYRERDRRDYNDDRNRKIEKSTDNDNDRSDRKSSRSEDARRSSRRR